MRQVEDLYAALPPKFVLDHYFEFLGLMDWRAQLEFFDEKKLNLPEIKDAILRNANEQSAKIPWYSRVWLRSFDVAEEAFNSFLKAGLLIKEGETFHKSQDFSQFYHLVKKTKSSARRQIAWAIWYLHCNAATLFHASELQGILSYNDKQYLGELQHLRVWKSRHEQVKVLRKSGNEWQIIEKPPTNSKAFLSMDLTHRLFAVISRIGSLGSIFSDQEMVEKIRELEFESIQKILRQFGLREEETGQWTINTRALELVKEVLFESFGICWPYFAVFTFENPYFKLGNNKAYVDIPNESIVSFLSQLQSLGEEHGNDLEILHQRASELKDTYNTDFEEKLGKSLKFMVRREAFGERKLGVQVRINWNNLSKFIDIFAKSNAPLEDKYEYLYSCRGMLAWMKSRPDADLNLKESVGVLAELDIQEINLMIKRFNDTLKTFRNKMRQKFVAEKHPFPKTLAYMSEILLSLKVIETCVKEGTIPTCYREMRKILENLSRVLFDDLLLFEGSDYFLKWAPLSKESPHQTDGSVIRLIGKIASMDLSSLYRKYNRFVHSDEKTWQIVPFSSVLEFKIFRYELSSFLDAISQILRSYSKKSTLIGE